MKEEERGKDSRDSGVRKVGWRDWNEERWKI